MRPAEAPTEPYKTVKMAAFVPVGRLPSYDIQVEDVHEFYAVGICVQNCMGNYHPHGDSSIGGAIETMVHAPEPYVDGNGSNWGSITDDASALRYCEGKLTEYAWTNFFEGDKVDVIDMAFNYDDTTKEPVWLPSNTCNLLVNGTYGISVGAAVNIPSFSLQSVNAIIVKALSQKAKLTVKDATSTLRFSSIYDGEVVKSAANRKAFDELVKNGIASIDFAPKYHVEKDAVVVTGFTAHLRSGKALEKIANDDRVAYLHDETSIEKGARFVVKLKQGIKPEKDVIASILKPLFTREAFKVSYLIEQSVKDADADNTEMMFKASGLIELIYNWIDWRLTLEGSILDNRIKLREATVERLNLLLLGFNNRDVLDACRDDKDPRGYLMKKLKVNEKQADVLLSLTVRQLTKLYNRDLLAEIKSEKDAIADLMKQRKNPTRNIIAALGAKG